MVRRSRNNKRRSRFKSLTLPQLLGVSYAKEFPFPYLLIWFSVEPEVD